MKSYKFDDIEDWLAALSEGRPVAIMPTPMAAEVLDESASALSKKLKNEIVPSISIGDRTLLSADWVNGEVVKAGRLFDDTKTILERVARRGSIIFYGDLMAELDMSWQSPPDRKKIGMVLGDISAASLEEEGIFLSSIVHRKGAAPTHPGPGYIGLLKILKDEDDVIDYDPEEDEMEMIARHMANVWKHYKSN